MQSLACVAADVANLNSFSLLPLGLAWMTSLHFSLDELLSQSLKRSTFASRTATLDATSPIQRDPDKLRLGGGKKETNCTLLKFKLVAGHKLETP